MLSSLPLHNSTGVVFPLRCRWVAEVDLLSIPPLLSPEEAWDRRLVWVDLPVWDHLLEWAGHHLEWVDHQECHRWACPQAEASLLLLPAMAGDRYEVRRTVSKERQEGRYRKEEEQCKGEVCVGNG
mmetsp:Transcript_30173/g.77949  ORF Transcript_30173/g.77949 Transcript_30173/m.77949 type:complete len:126 (-) Transcript_30173:3125-3502(-)